MTNALHHYITYNYIHIIPPSAPAAADLENSTAIASSCPKSFEKVQEMHDSLLREMIQRHGGYEINTEGEDWANLLGRAREERRFFKLCGSPGIALAGGVTRSCCVTASKFWPW